MEPKGRTGTVFAIGGAEDKTKGRQILRAFVEAAGGYEASVVVLSTASELEGTGERYARLFQDLEVDSVEVVDVRTREDAWVRMDEAVDALEFATGVFLTGGNQLRLSTILGGTPLAEAIRRRHRDGMVVAGTSAGAAVLSEHMIASGRSGGTPRRRSVQLAPGLGVVPDLIIDQHFRERDRLGRLIAAASLNPRLLGVGLDEDTAIVLESAGSFEVTGTGGVTVVDTSRTTFSSADAIAHGDMAVAVLGLRVDVLVAGCRYDVAERRAHPPAARSVAEMATAGPSDREEPDR